MVLRFDQSYFLSKNVFPKTRLFVDMENSVAMADTLLDPRAEMIVYQWGVHSMNYELDSEGKVTGFRYNDAAGQAATHILPTGGAESV